MTMALASSIVCSILVTLLLCSFNGGVPGVDGGSCGPLGSQTGTSISTGDDVLPLGVSLLPGSVSVLPQTTVCAVNGDVSLSGNAAVGSSDAAAGVHANGSVFLFGSTVVYGEATSSAGSVVLRGKATAENVEEAVPPAEGIQVALSRYSREADEGVFWYGHYRISDSCFLGPMRITGDLIISGGATVILCGTVYVDGDIRLTGGSRIEGTGVMVAEGDITITGEVLLSGESDRLIVSVNGDIWVIGNSFVIAALCAPDGSVVLAGKSMVFGAVVARDVVGRGNIVMDGFPV